MRAFDTCLLARFVLDDDARQSPIARTEIAKGGFIPLTVLLELGWLLRSRFAFPKAAIAQTLADIVRLPGITTVDEQGVLWACDRIERGADIGDMIHLVASRSRQSFLTFDDMRAEAGADALVTIELLA